MNLYVKISMKSAIPMPNNKQPAQEKSRGRESDDVPTLANARRFASEDPLVADLANKICDFRSKRN